MNCKYITTILIFLLHRSVANQARVLYLSVLFVISWVFFLKNLDIVGFKIMWESPDLPLRLTITLFLFFAPKYVDLRIYSRSIIIQIRRILQIQFFYFLYHVCHLSNPFIIELIAIHKMIIWTTLQHLVIPYQMLCSKRKRTNKVRKYTIASNNDY